jgi:transcription elongation factor Elf1
MADEKKYYCITCNAEKGMTVLLSEDSRSGELVCKLNPKHRFKMTKSGYLEVIPERR